MIKNSNTLSKELVEKLKNEVIKNLNDNDKLPSEREISNQYNVSRTTVRNALSELEISGYIYRQHGRGTFVAFRPKDVINLSDTFSFSQYMKEKKIKSDTYIVSFKEIMPELTQARKLRINKNTPIYELKRIRSANEEPLMFEKTYLNKNIFEGLTLDKLQTKALYDIFNDTYGIKIKVADEICRASVSDIESSKLLKIPKKSSCLSLERVTSDKDDRIVEFTQSTARADRFVYHIQQYYQG